MEKLKKFDKAAYNVLQLISERIPGSSFFVATTRNNRFKILEKLVMQDGCIIPDGVNKPLEESYCNIVANKREPVLISDTSTNFLVKDLAVTDELKIGSYIGVPIMLEDGSVFGTLCALDPKPYVLKQEDIHVLELYASFISTTIELEEVYFRLTDYEQQMKKELNLARNIQRSFISDDMNDERIKIDFLYTPSSHLSGDLCRWEQVNDGIYIAVVLDVMGHGVSSAMIGMAITPILKSISTEKNSPFDVMNELNKSIKDWFKDNDHISPFVTGIYLLIDTNKQEIKYYNAGHPAGFLLNNDATVTLLNEGSLPLGIVSDLPNIETTISYKKSSEILLYSDGVLDQFMEKGNNNKVIPRLMDKYQQSVLNGIAFIPYLKEKINAIDFLEDDVCAVTITLK
ncbi:SpoIIE family protein phosphatase [Metabacillus litoralis]|uniref:SpoIIE family protein phosphatase n=1 Tax=Metabacillus litoralis TaxID=152268 RepID=A0A5C6W181_9BACI|nr:GAF domain-containing SpoIIE family protein phosphatase [Metabacillus litoralis]TXC91096.1 SpoIIE family protein phosphatase [Metabacillus litoralis]